MSEGKVKAIAYRSNSRDSMIEIDQCSVLAGKGLELETRKPGTRNVTLLAVLSWQDVCRDLNVELPWHIRRANLLVEGADLQSFLSKTISIGELRVEILDETRPCKLMDELHEGLREALKPAFRGGVFGRVLTGGAIAVGDTVGIISPSA